MASWLPWQVIRDGKTTSEHKHYGQAHTEAVLTNGDAVEYVNLRGVSSVVWVNNREEKAAAERSYL